MNIRSGLVLSSIALLLVAACSSSTAAFMPNVQGQRLDLAYSDLAAAGVDKEAIEIVGGGTFGVIDESNWTVCQQAPSAGEALASVRLVVDRSCAVTAPAEPSPLPSDPALLSPTPSTQEPSLAEPAPETELSDTFAMPNVVGMVLQDAQDLLQSKGSYLMDQVDATGLGRMQLLDSNWKVCSQQPVPGTPVSIADFVTLSAVKLSESC
ncbi:MAG: PASTA domain-containing protein, partial [Actinomycetota bacterium]|nr:PASTA domain-containing protein [Actinomycetota bacterium]MDP2287908.1 PASTA domain-containing protein [Actinomycetota bacterium]